MGFTTKESTTRKFVRETEGTEQLESLKGDFTIGFLCPGFKALIISEVMWSRKLGRETTTFRQSNYSYFSPDSYLSKIKACGF